MLCKMKIVIGIRKFKGSSGGRSFELSLLFSKSPRSSGPMIADMRLCLSESDAV
jgi:hypothetical protein